MKNDMVSLGRNDKAPTIYYRKALHLIPLPFSENTTLSPSLNDFIYAHAKNKGNERH